jgi:hypothetical protein
MKKVNPRRKPASEADVRRAREEAVKQAVQMASAIILTVLVDKFDAKEEIPTIWSEVNKLSEEIKEGRVSVADLTHVLKTEYDIIV